MTEQETVTLIETEQRSKANSHRLDSVESEIKEIQKEQKAIYSIASSVEVIAQRINHIEEKVDDTNRKVDEQVKASREVEERLKERTNEPYIQTAKNVNQIKVAAITAICTLMATGLVMAIVNFVR